MRSVPLLLFYLFLFSSSVHAILIPGHANANLLEENFICDVIPPILPNGTSYFSSQEFGITIEADFPDDLPPSGGYEIVWFDSKGIELAITDSYTVNRELPRGLYYFSVAIRDKSDGCLSPPVNFEVTVDSITITLEDCAIAESSNIRAAFCNTCEVLKPGAAVDADLSTFSEIKAVQNTFPGSFIYQELGFPIVGNRGDSVQVFLSFPGFPGALPPDLSSISFTLYNGTIKVGNEYFLNSPDVSIRKESGLYSFTVRADVGASVEYERVRVTNYNSRPAFIATVRAHFAEMFFAIPTLPPNPIIICAGTSTRIETTPGENTFLRWYSEDVGGVELSSGSAYTTPILDTPGDYTYWIAILRSNCESSLRFPVQVRVPPLPESSDLMVSQEVNAFYCYGDDIVLKPEISTESSFLTTDLVFEWFYDSLGLERIMTGSLANIHLSPEGVLEIKQGQPGKYQYFLGALNQGKCKTSPSQLKRIKFEIGNIIPTPIFKNNNPIFCEEEKRILADLTDVSGAFELNWYTDDTRSKLLPTNTLLIDGGVYFAVSRNTNGCESIGSTRVQVQLNFCAPILRLQKKPDLLAPYTIIAGEELTYSIQIANDGIYSAYDLVIEDVLPSGTSYLSSTPVGTVSGNTIRWQLDSLSGGDSLFYVLRLRVSPSFAIGTSVRNIADLISTDVPGGVLKSEAEPVLVTRKALVGISKELLDTNPAYPGDTVGYRIRVWNAGPSDSDALRVVDVLATDLEFISSQGGKYNATNREVEWNISGLSVGDTVSYLLSVRVSQSAQPGLVGNTAVLRNKAGVEEDSDSAEAIEVVPDNRISLILQKSLPTVEVRVGSDYQYRIFLKNTGSTSLKNLVVVDTLDSNLSFISSNLLPKSNANGILRWEVEKLDSGDSISIDVLVSLEYQKELIGSVINNQVWVSSVNYNQTWFAEVNSIILSPNPTELIASKILLKEFVSVGDLIRYDVSIENIGEIIAYDLIITDFYPKGLLYVGMEGPGRIEVYSDSLIVTIDRMLPGEKVKIQLIFVLIEFTDQMVNIAQLTSENTPDIDVVADAIKLKKVELEILKTVSDEFVEVGKEFSYVLTVTNNSQFTATEVIATDILPTEVEYIRSESTKGLVSFSISDRKIEWLLDSLQTGEQAELRLYVKAVEASRQVINSASVTSKEKDSDYSNNEDAISHSQIKLHFPNVFTPNGDGVNDRWEITGLEAFSDNTLQIVNRWGVRVFEAEGYTNNWMGDNLSDGTYFYIFKWSDSANTSYEKTGFITLVR
jgi:gliding motility-associated-like protein/uncharacterized repeat protein (TIGR01451 family)